jgi:CO dehydrogenase/acetyl-CoA synthase delta subunit
VVESPTQPSADALACIGDLLQATNVPPFVGGDVTLSKSVFVASDAPNTAGGEIFVKRDAQPRSGGHPLTLAP